MSIKKRTIIGMILGLITIILSTGISDIPIIQLITLIIGGLIIIFSILLEPTDKEKRDDKGYNNKSE